MVNRMGSIGVFIFLLVVLPPSSSHASSEAIDSLTKKLPYVASDTHKVWMLRDIAYYYQSERPDSAIPFARRGYNLARSLNFPSGQIWNLYQEGLAYELLNHLDTALHIYDRAIELAIRHEDDLSRAKFFNILGVAHYFDGNYTDAIQYYSRGFSLSDSIGYNEGKAHALNNLGVIYRKQRRFDRALDVYKRSLKLKEMERDTNGIIISYYNIGLSYSYLGNYGKSLDHLLQAQKMAEDVNQMKWDKSHIQVAIGVAYFNLEDYDKAKLHLRRGIETNTSGHTAEYVSALAYLGAVQIMEGEKTEGMELIEQSYGLASQLGQRALLRDVLKQRAIAAENTGQYEIATESWRAFADLNEEINSEAQNWAMEEMNAKFELKDKEATIALQELELEREKARRNKYMVSGLSLLLLLSISVVFIHFFWRKREQLKRAVLQKEDALAKNELLLKEMHHRTKNNLQLLQSLLSLQGRNSKSREVHRAIQSSKDSVGAIGLLHHHLYQNGDFQTVAMKPYIEDLANYFRGAFGLDSRGIQLVSDCDDLQLGTDLSIPLGLIINELVTNAIKHAFRETGNGTIAIRLVRSPENGILLQVTDNGSGMSGNGSETGGMGKDLLELFSRRFNARLAQFDCRPGSRTEFEIPLTN